MQTEQTPLSLEDLRAIVPEASVMKYSALQRYNFLPPTPFIVLYETEPNFGHWVAVLETPEGYEHFDSFGVLPDGELKWCPAWLRHQTGQDVKRLLTMLYLQSLSTGKKVNYNNHKLQGERSMTCGRWCALRIRNWHLSCDEFFRGVKRLCRRSHLSPDQLVSTLIK